VPAAAATAKSGGPLAAEAEAAAAAALTCGDAAEAETPGAAAVAAVAAGPWANGFPPCLPHHPVKKSRQPHKELCH